MPDYPPTDVVRRSLTTDIAAPYERCLTGAPRSTDQLRAAVAAYLEQLLERSDRDAFLDAGTARRVAAGCERLIVLLGDRDDQSAHAAVQAAVDYFLLEDDAEQDGSMIGFDDDLLVVRETFKALGWDDGGVLA